MAVNEYCLSTNYGTLTQYNGNYDSVGSYNGRLYFTGDGVTLAYIYFNTGTTSWCLSETLGGSCILFGKTNCYNNIPDLCSDLFLQDFCVTPTPTPTTNCESFTFEAVFQCDIPTTPTPTPTTTTTPTPTVTPSPSDVCSTTLNGFSFTFTQVTPTPTPTPTVTPSFGPIQRDCSFSGSATFNTIENSIICPQTKQFRDCETGQMYYTNDTVNSEYVILVDRIYNATVNGTIRCISYVGSSLNGGIDSIVINEGPYGNYSEGDCSLGCSGVPVSSTPTPTPTVTPTITKTPSLTPSNTSTPTPTPTSNLPLMCFTLQSELVFGLSWDCNVTASGTLNGKPFFLMRASDCTTPTGFVVFWNSTSNRWEYRNTAGTILYFHLDNPGSTPETNMTYSWVRDYPFTVSSIPLTSVLGACPTPTPTPSPTPTRISTSFRIFAGEKSCVGGICNIFPLPGIDTLVYVAVGQTPETATYIYTDASLTTLYTSSEYFKYSNKIYSISGGVPSFVCIVGNPC